jgi:hypothetical protein
MIVESGEFHHGIFLETPPSVAARLERALVPRAASADKSAIYTIMIVESGEFHHGICPSMTHWFALRQQMFWIDNCSSGTA